MFEFDDDPDRTVLSPRVQVLLDNIVSLKATERELLESFHFKTGDEHYREMYRQTILFMEQRFAELGRAVYEEHHVQPRNPSTD